MKQFVVAALVTLSLVAPAAACSGAWGEIPTITFPQDSGPSGGN